MENSDFDFGFKFSELAQIAIISFITVFTYFKAIEIYENYQYNQENKAHREYFEQKYRALKNYSFDANGAYHINLKDTFWIEETIYIDLDGDNPKCIDL